MSELDPRNCYECHWHFHCHLRRDVDNVIREHTGWFNVNMPGTPDWQRLFEALAKACVMWEAKKTPPDGE